MADSHASDDGFHEIQLNGKQLVFLFMAATVVSVVIFLCGVLVGRGVRAARGAVAQAAALDEVPAPDVAGAQVPAPPSSVSLPAGSDPTAAPPPPALDDLTYSNRLEKTMPTTDDLKPKPDPVADPRAEATANSAPAATLAPSTKNPSTKIGPAPTAGEPRAAAPGSGYVVQVAAVNARAEAESIARRLSTKGYGAYVEAPEGGSSSVFRVRVGPFNTRRDADVVAATLQSEEQIRPWVTR